MEPRKGILFVFLPFNSKESLHKQMEDSQGGLDRFYQACFRGKTHHNQPSQTLQECSQLQTLKAEHMGAASPWAVPSPWACKGDTEGLGGLSCLLLQDEKSQQSQNSFPPANCSPAHFPTQESLTMWYQSLSQHRFKAGDAESDKVLLSLLITLLH